jgi:hypothetical protein
MRRVSRAVRFSHRLIEEARSQVKCGRPMSQVVIRHPIPQGTLEVWNVESQTWDARVHWKQQQERQSSGQTKIS